jgi:hypothetical protein
MVGFSPLLMAQEPAAGFSRQSDYQALEVVPWRSS